jgi:hypothetical protein
MRHGAHATIVLGSQELMRLIRAEHALTPY